MTRKLIALGLALVLIFAFAACDTATPAPDAQHAPDANKNTAAPDIVPVAVETVDYTAPPPNKNLKCYDVDDEGNLYISAGIIITKYTPDGESAGTYKTGAELAAMSYGGGYLYCLYSMTGAITRVSLETGEEEVLNKNPGFIMKKNMEVADGALYIVASPDVPDAGMLVEGEIAYRLYKCDTETGEVTEIDDVENPISLYRSADGKLYIYAGLGREYALYEYDTERGRAEEVAEINDIENVNMFAYENETFIAVTNMYIQAMTLPGSEPYTIETISTQHGGGMNLVYSGGKILFFESREDGALLRTLSVGEHIRLTPSTGEPIVEEIGAITIANNVSSFFYGKNHINTDKMFQRTGIYADIKYIRETGFSVMREEGETREDTDAKLKAMSDASREKLESELELALMSGDDEVDIYLLPLEHSKLLNSLVSGGGYEPLNDNKIITDYLDGCFDWVRDAVTAPNGDIAMFPINFDIPVVWYSPENMEKFGVTADNLSTFDKLYETTARLNEEKGNYKIATAPTNLFSTLNAQYESLYCDVESKTAAFDTPLFRQLFNRLYTEEVSATWQMEVTFIGPTSEESKANAIAESIREEEYHPVLEYDILAVAGMTPDERRAVGMVNGYEYGFFADSIIFSIHEVNRQIGIDIGSEDPDNPYIEQVFASPPSPITDWRVLPPPRISEEITTNIFTEYVFAIINPNSKNKELAMKYLETITEDPHAVLPYGQFIFEDTAMYEGYYDMSEPVYQDLYDIYADGEVYVQFIPGEERQFVIDKYNSGELSAEEAVMELDRKARFIAGE